MRTAQVDAACQAHCHGDRDRDCTGALSLEGPDRSEMGPGLGLGADPGQCRSAVAGSLMLVQNLPQICTNWRIM